ncbi:MAG: hypothetical protein RI972_1353 [Pseudomonadota bacterium]
MAARFARYDTDIARLSGLVQSQDIPGLEGALRQIGLRTACSADFLQRCRMRHATDLVLLLATLCVSNQIQVELGQSLLDFYQSVARGQAQGRLSRLDRGHVLRIALGRCLARRQTGPAADSAPGGKKLPPARWGGKDSDAELALELLLDHGCYADAVELIERRVQPRTASPHVLNLCEAFLSRVDAWTPVASDRRHLVKCYRRLYDAVSASPACVGVSEVLSMHLLRELVRSGDHAAALQMPLHFKQAGNRAVARYLKVEAACKLGLTARACEEMDGVLAAVVDQPQDWISANFRAPGGNGEAKPNFNLKAAREVLVDLQAVLANVGQRVFLVSGTLLGYARVRDFLTHDKDIDVGILAADDEYQTLEALANSGLFNLDARGLSLERNYNLAVTHRATGMAVDIFIYHPVAGKWVTGVRNNMGYLQCFAFTPFELQPIDFIGTSAWAPADLDLNLTENFGNWRVPDAGYQSHLESPSICDWGGEVHQLVGRLKLMEALIKDSHSMGVRVVRCLQRMQEFPLAISAELLGRIASARGFASPEGTVTFPSGDMVEMVSH